MIVRNVLMMEQSEEQAHGGQGRVRVCRPMNQSDFSGPWNFVAYAVMPPGTSIGLHRHEEEEELFFILDGEGLMTVNDEQNRVAKGDLILNPLGGTHGLVNDSHRDLSFLVVEVGLKK